MWSVALAVGRLAEGGSVRATRRRPSLPRRGPLWGVGLALGCGRAEGESRATKSWNCRLGAGVIVAAVVLGGCSAPAPTAEVATSVPTAVATPGPTRAVSVAVAARSPTPTVALVGDYATLLQPRLETLQQGLRRLEQQLSVLQTAPLRMAEDDWRTQFRNTLDDLSTMSADLRSLGTRVGAQLPLNAEVLKLTNDVDFVADEYRMALDYDPDSSHFIRAGRAEKTTADELASVVADVRRNLRVTPTPHA